MPTRKVWSVVVAVAAVKVVVTMAVMLVSPPTLYKPSATVLFHFVVKHKKIPNLETIGPRAL